MKKRSEVAVGAVILLSLLLVVGGTLWLKGIGFGDDEITVQARFLDIGQVAEGNAVKLRGVAIGRVERIQFEPAGRGVILDLRIGRTAPLPAEPVVLLSPESMFGDWQAEILPRDRFPTYSYAESPDPAVLPGYALPDISRLTAVADEISENLAELSERVGMAFTEETALQIREVIANIRDMSAQLAALVETQELTVQEVADNLENTSASLDETAQAAQHSFGRLESTLAQAESTLRAVEGVMGPVAEGEGTLGRLVQDTTLYTQIVDTNKALKALLDDIFANPGRYVKVEIF